MKKFNLGLLFIVFVMKMKKSCLARPPATIVFSVVDCQKWNSNGRAPSERKTFKMGTYYSEEINGGKSAEINSPLKSQPVKPSPRTGIGAWGYVSIILFVILSGVGVYYTILFYPIVCKKQRMYHVMGSTTV